MRNFLLTIFCLLFLAAPSWAMRTPILGSFTPSTSVTNYVGFYSTAAGTADDTTARNVSPASGIIEGLAVMANTAPGGSASYALTLMKNGSATTITCTITGAATTCNDNSHQVAITAGDTFSIKIVPASTPASSRLNYATTFNTNSGGPAVVTLASSLATRRPSTSVQDFSAIVGAASFGQSGASDYMPLSGTFGNLYVLAKTAPGTAASGKKQVFTVQKNGVDTAVTCTVLDTATSCSDTSNTFSVVPTDVIRLSSTPSNTPTTSEYTAGLTFTPAINGESFLSFFTSGSPNTSSDNYMQLNGASSGLSTTEAGVSLICPLSNVVAKNLYINAVAPGASKSFVHALRVNNATSTLTCTRTGASATTCNDTTNKITLSQNDIINFLASPSGTPTVGSTNRASVVLFIDPNDKIYGSALYGSTNY